MTGKVSGEHEMSSDSLWVPWPRKFCLKLTELCLCFCIFILEEDTTTDGCFTRARC